ncbi:MAG: RNA-directed DNA polymerase [Burkholderiales bacterium]|nr:RNA-directed DNA polymerase [Burkholderiales bacterium]
MLEENDLEFAARHIQRYYDTDFFPKHMGFEALWPNWEEVKRLILGANVAELPLSTPRILPWPKARGGYRVVHQLDPVSAIVYTAAAHSVASRIEAARIQRHERVACSYRISIADGSFFELGTGYDSFRTASSDHSEKYAYVLLTDITDFYNQIYVHRVANAIATSEPRNAKRANEIEQLLMIWNSKSSQGIPVGPAASILMSEAVLIDVDHFIQSRGLVHTRYVDDFRIFSDSKSKLQSALRELTTYLYEVHRLNLSGEKTKILKSVDFAKESIHNQYELEKVQIFEGIAEVANPYTQEVEEAVVELGREDALTVLTGLLKRVLGLPTLDLGLARAILRKARGLQLYEMVPDVAVNAERLLPVINDVFLYFAEAIPSWSRPEDMQPLARLATSSLVEEPAFATWMEWMLTKAPMYLDVPELARYLDQHASCLGKARVAVIRRNIAWVREMRLKYFDLPISDRLAVILASPILAIEEREPFLKRIGQQGSGATQLERWYAKVALAGGISHEFADPSADLPF